MRPGWQRRLYFSVGVRLRHNLLWLRYLIIRKRGFFSVPDTRNLLPKETIFFMWLICTCSNLGPLYVDEVPSQEELKSTLRKGRLRSICTPSHPSYCSRRVWPCSWTHTGILVFAGRKTKGFLYRTLTENTELGRRNSTAKRFLHETRESRNVQTDTVHGDTWWLPDLLDFS